MSLSGENQSPLHRVKRGATFREFADADFDSNDGFPGRLAVCKYYVQTRFSQRIHEFSMPRLLEPLWLILATLTDKQLGQIVEFLREESHCLFGLRSTDGPTDRARLAKHRAVGHNCMGMGLERDDIPCSGRLLTG